jgi:hypothetical protein
MFSAPLVSRSWASLVQAALLQVPIRFALVPQARKGENGEKHCTHCGCDVDRDVNAAKNMLEVFLFHVRGWGRPEYLCRPNQHAALPQGVPAPQPQTADV